ncbi:MAG TPA: recombinase family protein, partial [Gemmatimonadales bacterium]
MVTPKVYSYLRWSTREQEEGDSERRQLEAAQAFAAEKGMVVDEELRDDGKSAFYGKNILEGAQAGALGRFLERIALGDIAPGSVLVLENLDRMSRQVPHLALGVLSRIIEAGVAVHTTNDHQTYTKEVMRGPNGLSSLLIALLAFNTAHQESEKKRRRLQDVWRQKRLNASKRPMFGKGPSWLTFDKEAERWELIPDRAEIVRRVFRETIAGKGADKIAKGLNLDGVPPFDRGKTTAKAWTGQTIAKILDHPAVIGTMVPKVLAYDDNGRQRRVPQKELTVEDYYPA